MDSGDPKARFAEALKRAVESELAVEALQKQQFWAPQQFDKSSTSPRSYHSKGGNPFSKSKIDQEANQAEQEEAYRVFATRFLTSDSAPGN
jgi:hypothetical protein